MDAHKTDPPENVLQKAMTRRRFVGNVVTAAASASLLGPAATAAPDRKIKLGVIGCGGRGAWQ
jgi:hypothetical protein